MLRRFVMLMAVMSIAAIANSDTVIPGGNVSGVWEASGSPYLIQGEITVHYGDTLLINPGVDVIFRGHYEFIVHGVLEAIGTQRDSITFTAMDTAEGWHGIRFLGAPDTSRLSYCIIQYGRATTGTDRGGGIYSAASLPIIEHCTIRWNESDQDGGGIYFLQTDVTIRHSTISDNFTNGDGGGICCYLSNTIIESCTFKRNRAVDRGGGIHCDAHPSPFIRNCLLIENSTENHGGAIACSGSNPIIESCTIQRCSTLTAGGGGIWGINSDPLIWNCIITNCYAALSGGGINFHELSTPVVNGCLIQGNTALDWGGGVYLQDTINPLFKNCEIVGNRAYGTGGGYAGQGTLQSCTLYRNVASSTGGLHGSNTAVNCIVWSNSPDQIGGSSQVTYTDVMGGWPGTGNINSDPMFLYPQQNDLRLQWDSPCIDAGNPDPFYNDPDGTIADMGAFYYSQLTPLCIRLTPHNAPNVIPAEGGSFDVTVWLTNIDPQTLNVNAYCTVTFPDGSYYGPVLGPVNLDIGSGVTISSQRTQIVPPTIPGGQYTYHAFASALPSISHDYFSFFKLGSGGLDELGRWFNSGESFEELLTEDEIIPKVYSLEQNYPNPFNPLTAIRFGLPEDGQVRLTIYDMMGRQVAILVDGYRLSGVHEVTFDGSNLASGIYIHRLEANNFTASGKLVLLK